MDHQQYNENVLSREELLAWRQDKTPNKSDKLEGRRQSTPLSNITNKPLNRHSNTPGRKSAGDRNPPQKSPSYNTTNTITAKDVGDVTEQEARDDLLRVFDAQFDTVTKEANIKALQSQVENLAHERDTYKRELDEFKQNIHTVDEYKQMIQDLEAKVASTEAEAVELAQDLVDTRTLLSEARECIQEFVKENDRLKVENEEFNAALVDTIAENEELRRRLGDLGFGEEEDGIKSPTPVRKHVS
ncbi:hypothetical protein BZG36_01502 [Bifiguratus adelaidae]|uniref:Uncharacterized protein n=1 Tax=Bifiguratus adelaidae TaxID=1938954 RepID=A0A261Y4U3_9FUNG|nr:hypothetical protein BZG36_01502 [Bifiguratus adelaidae]